MKPLLVFLFLAFTAILGLFLAAMTDYRGSSSPSIGPGLGQAIALIVVAVAGPLAALLAFWLRKQHQLRWPWAVFGLTVFLAFVLPGLAGQLATRSEERRRERLDQLEQVVRGRTVEGLSGQLTSSELKDPDLMASLATTAAAGSSAEVVMFLVARMPPSKYRASQVSDLLLTATDNPDPGVAARLLDEGAVLDQLDAYSRTAAMDAAAKGNLAVLRLFAQRGLEVGRRDSRGNTLLHQFVLEDVAGRPDPEAMVRWLVAQGVDPNAANEEGLRPLSGWLTDDPSRAGTRRRETLRALLAHGADPRLPGAGSRDASALDWARQNRMEGFPDLLQELERSTTKAE